MKKKCFVIMPFHKNLDSVYNTIINICTLHNIDCQRTDEIAIGSITKGFIQTIHSSDIIIADLTFSNPNVFYELAISHCIGRKTIMLTQEEKIPFDIGQEYVIKYSNSLEGSLILEKKVKRLLEHLLNGGIIDNPAYKIATQHNPQIKGWKTIKSKDPSTEIIIKELQPESCKKLVLSWETFGQGIEILDESLNTIGGVHPDIIFGINETGIMIASYLRHKRPRIKDFGYFFMGSKNDDNKKRDEDKSYLPYWGRKDKPPVILLVDSEIKSGITGKTVIDRIKQEYNTKNIKYICLGGVVKDKTKIIKSVSDFGWDLEATKEDEQYKPYALAYYISRPGFEPPGGVR